MPRHRDSRRHTTRGPGRDVVRPPPLEVGSGLPEESLKEAETSGGCGQLGRGDLQAPSAFPKGRASVGVVSAVGVSPSSGSPREAARRPAPAEAAVRLPRARGAAAQCAAAMDRFRGRVSGSEGG